MKQMANKKKRNKHYTGPGAAVHTTFTKVSAVKRHPVHQWLYDRRQFRRPLLIAALIAFGVIIIVTGIIGLFIGSR
jgi:hypothetical protein